MSQLESGSTLRGGTYIIQKVLGQGSFGITYLAEHTALARTVAIKEFFMKGLNSRNNEGLISGMDSNSLSFKYGEKFKREAANLARMKHPNIVEVSDAFSENGTFYYVMEFIEGQNLNEYLKNHPISEDEAADISHDIALALQYMHDKHRMLHLDLKPGNVMRRNSDGHIFLIDFGLSKHYGTSGQPETSTSIGLGTAGYAPIEQGNQAKDGDFRPTIDVYALGATLFKLLTGTTPPEASEIAFKKDYIPNILESSGVSPRMTAIVTNAMAPDPNNRTATMRDFIKQLPTITMEKKEALLNKPAKTDSAVPEVIPPETTLSAAPSEDATIIENKKSKSKDGVIAGIMISIIAVIAAACFFFLQDGSDKYYYNENATFDQIKADAEEGNSAAQSLLSWYYANGMNSVPINQQQSFEWAQKSAEQSNPIGKCQLAWYYETGTIVEKDYQKAAELITEALPLIQELADKGNARAQNSLGSCFAEGFGIRQDNNEAFKWFQLAAKQGHAGAQANLGYCYSGGNGVKQNHKEAVKYWQLAAEQGHVQAQFALGGCYYNGQGVKQDYNTAIKMFTLAAEQGDVQAQFVLGGCYYNGHGVKQDYNIAAKWLGFAAEQGHAEAQSLLGILYLAGTGVKEDCNEAVKWFRLAADQDDAQGQWGLGKCYENGYGVSASKDEAIKWYKLAAQQGFELAKNNLRNLGINEW